MSKDLTCSLPRKLSAKYTEDFAYLTLKDRLPIIITKVIDSVYRLKNCVGNFFPDYSEDDVRQDLKHIVSMLSKTKSELQTNKKLLYICDNWQDSLVWNNALQEELQIVANDECRWFDISWLFSECYFYRRMFETVQTSAVLKFYDLFGEMKRDAFKSSVSAMEGLASYLLSVLPSDNHEGCDMNMNETVFKQLLQVCLWGNKCDLSISAGMENSQQNNPISQLPTLQPYILVNDEDKIWLYLKRNSIDRLDIILDNAGFELFCDLCLADYLISLKLAKKIYFHCKNMPWFVSDVTSVDWFWTLKQMQQVDIIVLQQLGIRWENYMSTSQWVLENDMFWTTPFEFIRMAAISPILYSDLQKSQLLLFKGDLNYRKLIGDRKWPSIVPFDDALCGFSPAPLCALRSLKSDLVTGLLSNVAEKLTVTEPNWMISGQYAVIQCNQLLIQSFCTHDEQN